jgi:NAD(P)-dependent dehydrogenase (short-subunit alcohol dehydrogenase family)
VHGNEGLEDRVALVTGGSRGLGREIALGLARAGCDIVIASRNEATCRTVGEEVRAIGRRALPIGCHVGRWDELDALVERVYDEWGAVDVLVNNAGMSPVYPSLTAVSEEMFDKVIAVNLRAPFRLSALIGERMAEGRGGTIVNISSVAATEPYPGALPYAAAKAGLNALTAGLAHSFGPQVRANAVMAGPFLTDVSDGWDMDAVGPRLARAALGRAGHPDEIVGAVLYFAGSASSFTTGAVLTVDGGRR